MRAKQDALRRILLEVGVDFVEVSLRQFQLQAGRTAVGAGPTLAEAQLDGAIVPAVAERRSVLEQGLRLPGLQLLERSRVVASQCRGGAEAEHEGRRR